MALLDMRTNIGVGDDTTSSCNSFDRLLLVDVRAARNLRNRNMMGTVSPRVEISFPHSRGVPSWESSVCNETTEPVWNQSTFFLIPRQAHGFSVRVLSGGKNLGGFDFSLVDNPLFDPTIGWFPLDEDRGEVHLGWRVFPLVHMAELPEQVAAQQQELEEMQRQHRIEVTALQAQLEASDRRVAELDGGKDQAFQHISQENASLTSVFAFSSSSFFHFHCCFHPFSAKLHIVHSVGHLGKQEHRVERQDPRDGAAVDAGASEAGVLASRCFDGSRRREDLQGDPRLQRVRDVPEGRGEGQGGSFPGEGNGFQGPGFDAGHVEPKERTFLFLFPLLLFEVNTCRYKPPP